MLPIAGWVSPVSTPHRDLDELGPSNIASVDRATQQNRKNQFLLYQYVKNDTDLLYLS